MSTAPYSQEYFPPAPVLPVHIAPVGESPNPRSFSALVDTGADGTFIPTSIIEKLGIPVVYMTNVRSHLGEGSYRAPVYLVDILLMDSWRLPGIEIVGDDWGNRIILGRNVLNKLKLYLDGPSGATDIQA